MSCENLWNCFERILEGIAVQIVDVPVGNKLMVVHDNEM